MIEYLLSSWSVQWAQRSGVNCPGSTVFSWLDWPLSSPACNTVNNQNPSAYSHTSDDLSYLSDLELYDTADKSNTPATINQADHLADIFNADLADFLWNYPPIQEPSTLGFMPNEPNTPFSWATVLSAYSTDPIVVPMPSLDMSLASWPPQFVLPASHPLQFPPLASQPTQFVHPASQPPQFVPQRVSWLSLYPWRVSCFSSPLTLQHCFPPRNYRHLMQILR